ncbi:hypothetical protein OPQ81_005726 [Rhizoctonia solani]|nr:hypothetical protein OPQ81_005726 [Rhizoctonia solani]
MRFINMPNIIFDREYLLAGEIYYSTHDTDYIQRNIQQGVVESRACTKYEKGKQLNLSHVSSKRIDGVNCPKYYGVRGLGPCACMRPFGH